MKHRNDITTIQLLSLESHINIASTLLVEHPLPLRKKKIMVRRQGTWTLSIASQSHPLGFVHYRIPLKILM